ncbi:MAG: hypothetical protein ACE5E6_00665 [Phycisphaerae bacterium]
MGVHRSELRERRRLDAIATRVVNRGHKDKERARRDARMCAKVQAGSLPYGPGVMSWASRYLDKPSSHITQADLNGLVKRLAASGNRAGVT